MVKVATVAAGLALAAVFLAACNQQQQSYALIVSDANKLDVKLVARGLTDTGCDSAARSVRYGIPQCVEERR